MLHIHHINNGSRGIKLAECRIYDKTFDHCFDLPKNHFSPGHGHLIQSSNEHNVPICTPTSLVNAISTRHQTCSVSGEKWKFHFSYDSLGLFVCKLVLCSLSTNGLERVSGRSLVTQLFRCDVLISVECSSGCQVIYNCSSRSKTVYSTTYSQKFQHLLCFLQWFACLKIIPNIAHQTTKKKFLAVNS